VYSFTSRILILVKVIEVLMMLGRKHIKFIVALGLVNGLSGCGALGIHNPDHGRLLATGGVSQVEGAAGSGLSPWALISGYGSEDSIGGAAYYTQSNLDDFKFQSAGGSVGIKDRVEISYAKQTFDTGSTGPKLGLRGSYKFKQDIIGAKVRVLGNAVYDQDTWMPQVSVGAQYKKASDPALLRALGARNDEGLDFYASATKLALNKNLLIGATLRGTKANQLGLLGFGGDKNNKYKMQFEGSAALMLAKNVVVGADYRTKPDNLGFAKEQDAKAAYIAFFPSKHLSVTLAGVDMGDIALQGRQRGGYVSIQTGF